MVIGYVFTKKAILPQQTPLVFSRFLVWVCTPALYLRTFSSGFRIDRLSGSISLLLLSVFVTALIYVTAAVFGRFLIRDGYHQKVFTYSLCVPNTGYFGNALVLAVLGETVLLDFQIVCIPLTIFVATLGYSLLLEREINLRNLINPMMVSVLVGITLGLLRVPIHPLFREAFESASGCLGPLSMVLAGCVLAEFDLKRVLGMKDVYLTIGVKMVLMPLLVVAAGKLFHIPHQYYVMLLILECIPVGLNSVIFPSTIGKDCSFGAGLALVSSLVGIITVPLFFSLL